MKVRAQVAKPCEKKGDKLRGSPFCECMATCKQQKDFLKSDSTGTITHLRTQTSAFKGCLSIEKWLIHHNLIRYETREDGGLEVLFEGIETTQNLNAEIFSDEDDHASINVYLNTINNFLTDTSDNDRKLTKASSSDEGLREFLPEALGFAQSGANAFAALSPENLQDSFFEAMYSRGAFDRDSEDIQNLAACIYHRVDLPKQIKKIWPRYTERRYQENLAKIWAKVHKKMPFWAKRFNRIWDKLSEAQAQAVKLEWFYEGDEKPTQEEIAKKLGISIASYQERLNWAYKKLETLYPEFKRVPRREEAEDSKKKDIPYPLFKILTNGEKIEIPLPEARNKKLKASQRRSIKRWARLSTISYLFSQDLYTDSGDIEDEQEQEETEEAIEKEHEEYLLLKAESSVQGIKKVAL